MGLDNDALRCVRLQTRASDARSQTGLRADRLMALRQSFEFLIFKEELLGHATIEMTMHYAHLSPDAKREAVQCLDLPTPAPATPEGHKWGTWQ